MVSMNYCFFGEVWILNKYIKILIYVVLLFLEMSFFDKYEENEGMLRLFFSWYGGLDMGSLFYFYLFINFIEDFDIDWLLSIENEGLKFWKCVKKFGELEVYLCKGLEWGSLFVIKVIVIIVIFWVLLDVNFVGIFGFIKFY